MKTRMSSIWALGLVLIMAGASGAVAQATLGPSPASQPEVRTAGSKPTATDVAGPLTTLSPASVPSSIEKPDAKEQRPAPSAYVSSWLAEIVKLAKAGVDDSVLLTFVDSAGTFNLTADQIIVLRDLGVCNQVITAMIDHDFEMFSGLRPMPTFAVSASPPQITFATRSDVPRDLAAQQAITSTLVSAPAEGSAQSLASDDVSIVAHDQPQFAATDSIDDDWRPVIQAAAPARGGFSPVRAPYPVKLTDPIVFVRGAGRIPNIVVINMLR